MTFPFSSDFLIAGIRVRIMADREDSPYTSIVEDLGAMKISAEGIADCELAIYSRAWGEESPLKLPSDARLIRSGGRKVFEDQGNYFIDLHEEAFFALEKNRATGVCYWRPELDPMFWTEICLPYMLALLLRRQGRFLIHAGGAVSPDGTAMIFTGRSGSGKSTAAFRLAQAGWNYLGDDIVFFDKDYRIHSFPKLASATSWTAEKLGMESRIVRVRPTGKRIIRPWSASTIPVERYRIFAPIPATFAKNSIAPLDRESALEILTSQTQFCHTDHIVGGPTPDLAALADRCHEIRIGDLDTLPGFLE